MYTLGCSGADDVNIVLSWTPAPTIPSSSLSNGVLIQSEILSSLSLQLKNGWGWSGVCLMCQCVGPMGDTAAMVDTILATLQVI